MKRGKYTSTAYRNEEGYDENAWKIEAYTNETLFKEEARKLEDKGRLVKLRARGMGKKVAFGFRIA